MILSVSVNLPGMVSSALERCSDNANWQPYYAISVYLTVSVLSHLFGFLTFFLATMKIFMFCPTRLD